MMLTIGQTNTAIAAGMGDGEYTPERLLAAIAGTLIGQAYRDGIKVDHQYITINALASLVQGIERQQRADALGLAT